MKRTTTEIFIEVEETVAVRIKGKTANDESELNLTHEHSLCPFCGQPVNKIAEVKKKNKLFLLRRNDFDFSEEP